MVDTKIDQASRNMCVSLKLIHNSINNCYLSFFYRASFFFGALRGVFGGHISIADFSEIGDKNTRAAQ